MVPNPPMFIVIHLSQDVKHSVLAESWMRGTPALEAELAWNVTDELTVSLGRSRLLLL